MKHSAVFSATLVLFLGASAAWAEDAGGGAPRVGDIGVPKIYIPKDKAKNPFFREVDENFGKIKTVPGVCPICGQKVDIPLEPPKVSNVDSDLCPHPVGGVKFYAAIPCCPNCGFAAYREHFRMRQKPEVSDFVRKCLTENIRESERQLLALKVEKMGMSEKDIVDFFTQDDIPDAVRCEHALAFYAKFGAGVNVRSRLALLCAWAYRREVSSAMGSERLMDSVRRVMRQVENRHEETDKPEGRSKVLADLLRDGQGLGFVDRQMVWLMLAGDYDRLGYRQWAEESLRKVLDATQVRAGDKDPWLDGQDGSMEQRRSAAEMNRLVYSTMAKVRLAQLDREMGYLGQAADLMREELSSGLWKGNSEELRGKLYLIGECERRCGNFTRARLWLSIAARTVVAESKAEALAPKQLAVMDYYMKGQGVREFPYNVSDPQQLERDRMARFDEVQKDSVLTQKVLDDLRAAESLRRAVPAAPAAGTIQAEQGDGSRNEVQLPPLPTGPELAPLK